MHFSPLPLPSSSSSVLSPSPFTFLSPLFPASHCSLLPRRFWSLNLAGESSGGISIRFQRTPSVFVGSSSVLLCFLRRWVSNTAKPHTCSKAKAVHRYSPCTGNRMTDWSEQADPWWYWYHWKYIHIYSVSHNDFTPWKTFPFIHFFTVHIFFLFLSVNAQRFKYLKGHVT